MIYLLPLGIQILFALVTIGLLIAMLLVAERELRIQYYNPAPRFKDGRTKRIEEIELVATQCIEFEDN